MVELPPRFVRPAYAGGSIVNLPATIGTALGCDGPWIAPAVTAAEAVATELRYDRVVLVLLDGLGWNRWRAAAGDAAAPLAERLDTFGGAAWRITSVLPSTTSVATTTLLGNGAAPIEHGLVGYSVRLPTPGLVANLLFWRPEHGPGATGSLEEWGVVPEQFLARPSIFTILEGAGVRTRAFMPAAIARGSPLTRASMPGVDGYAWVGLDDALHGLETWLGAQRDRAFAYLYVPDLDTLSHRDGPFGAAGRAALAGLAQRMGSWLDRVAAAGGGRTLVLITADHGHAATPVEQGWMLEDGTALGAATLDMLSYPPAGEPRHVYLYARAGAGAELLDACRSRFGDAFVVLDGAAAIEAGLYGPPERAHAAASGRIGDVVLLARSGATFWSEPPDRHPVGMHGSMEAEEMEVPLLAFRP